MLLKLELPRFSLQIDEAIVTDWHVPVAGPIRYGQPIVDLEADSVKHLRRNQKATHFQAETDRGDEPGVFSMKTRVAVRIIASEDGYLRRVDYEVGDRAEVGSVLGLASNSPDEPISAEDTGTFRVVANLLDEGHRT